MANPAHAALDRLWKDAGSGLRVILIQGEAGCGKTHLARKFTEQALAGHGTCVLLPRGPLPGALLEGLYGLFKAEHHPEFLSYARRAAPHLSWSRLAAPQVGQVGSLWTALQRLALRERRLGLLIEDVHLWPKDQWDELQALIVFLQERGAPVLLALTARTDPGVGQRWQRVVDWLAVSEGGASVHVVIPPLTPAETGLLVSEQLRTSQEIEGLNDWLHTHTGGSALHTVLLLRLLRREGLLLDLGITWDFRPPRAGTFSGGGPLPLEDLLLLELQALTVALDLQILQAVALAGEVLTLAQLEAVLPQRGGLLGARLNVLTGPHLERVGADGGYRLRLSPMETVIRRETAWEEQLAWAERLIPQVRSPASRARLALTAGHGRAEEWAREALAAAQERRQHAEVVEFASALLQRCPAEVTLRRALWQAWVDLGDYASIIRRGRSGDPHCDIHLANALEVQGEYRQAIEVLEALPDDPEQRWKVLQRKLWCLDFLEDPPGLLRELQKYDGQEHHILEWAWAEYGRSQSDLQGRVRHMERALALLPPDSPELERAVIEGNLGAPMINTGQYAAAEAHLSRAAELFRGVGHSYGLLGCEINLAFLSLARGDYLGAHRQNLRMYAVADRMQDTRLMSGVLLNTASCEAWMGRPEQAVQNLTRSAELYRGYESARPSDLAHAQALAGLPDEARVTLQTPDHDPLPEHPLLRARTWLMLGELPQARSVLNESVLEASAQPAVPSDGVYTARRELLLCWLSWLEGDAPTALARLETAALALGEFDHPPLQAELTLVRALLEGEEAEVLHVLEERLRALNAGGHLRLYHLTQPRTRQVMGSAPAAEAAPQGQLFLQTLGAFGLSGQGVLMPWRGRKTRDLLALLLTAHLNGTSLGRGALTLELWPDATEQNAEVNFRKTLERLRQICQDAVSVVRSPQGHYSLGEVHADIRFFVAGLESGDLEQVFQWYAGPYLPDLGYSRVAELRDVLQHRLRDALLSQAHLYAPEQVLGWCGQYLEHDSCDLEVATLALGLPLPASDRTRQVRTAVLGRFQREWGFVPDELLLK